MANLKPLPYASASKRPTHPFAMAATLALSPKSPLFFDTLKTNGNPSAMTEQNPFNLTADPTGETISPAPEVLPLVVEGEEAVTVQLTQALEASEAKYNDLYQQFIRLSADFDNVRKRRQAEREQWLKYGAEPTLQALLPVMDNIARAIAALNENMEPAILLKSIGLIEHQLASALTELGLNRMQTQGQLFNANLHEAIASHPTTDVPEGHVVMEQQAGYHLHDKVLRPALVVVAAPVETPEAAPEHHPVDTSA